jgi:hypothetical protein
MADDVWRGCFDRHAPQSMNEASTADGVPEAEFLVELIRAASPESVARGTFGRRPVDLDEREIMVVMRRPEG